LQSIIEAHTIRLVDNSFYFLNNEKYYDSTEKGLLLDAEWPVLIG